MTTPPDAFAREPRYRHVQVRLDGAELAGAAVPTVGGLDDLVLPTG